MFGVFDTQYGAQQGFVPRDPLSATNPPRDPLSPGRPGPSVNTPPAPEDFLQKQIAGLRSGLGQAAQTVSALPGQVQEGVAGLKTRYPNLGGYARGGLAIAAALPAAGTALKELEAGRPTGALAALAPAGLSAAGTALLGKGPVGTAVGLGLMGLGAVLPGASAQAAESVRQGVTGKPTKGKEEEFSTQLAMRGQIMNQNLDALNRDYALQLQATKDLTTFQNEAMLQQYKAMAPELEKAKMNDFARYQTAMALQGQIQGRLGTLATAGAMAREGQAGNYALTQTALTTNPYAGATLQAPQIRFG